MWGHGNLKAKHHRAWLQPTAAGTFQAQYMYNRRYNYVHFMYDYLCMD